MKLFSKDNDYNLILEKILDSKYFSSNTKSLLLSMIYKIEISYPDYQKAKGIDKTKEEFLEELIDIIKKYCDNIKLVEPDTEEAKIIKENNLLALTNEKERSILSYPTEIALLYSISDVLPKYFYISDKFLFKNAFQNMLVNGYNQNNLEILTDFNGWSWDINLKVKNNIIDNLIYQNFICLFGIKFMDNWLEYSKINEAPIEQIKNSFSGTKYFELLQKYFYNCSSEKDKEKIDKIFENKKIELRKIANKPKYFEELKMQKLETLKEIENIDKLLSNKDKLMQKYISENLKLELSKKFKTVNDYKKMLQNKRKDCLENVADLTNRVKPMNYISYKKELEEVINIVKNKLDNKKIAKLLQIEFVKVLKEKVEDLEAQEEIIGYIYKIRYYKYLYFNNETQIKDDKDIKIDEVLKILIKKACEKSILKVIVSEPDINSEIIKNILDTKIINLEEIRFELNYKVDKLNVKVYEKEVYEKEFIVDFPVNKKEILLRQRKIQKLFI